MQSLQLHVSTIIFDRYHEVLIQPLSPLCYSPYIGQCLELGKFCCCLQCRLLVTDFCPSVPKGTQCPGL
jgi:hypothetical protein